MQIISYDKPKCEITICCWPPFIDLANIYNFGEVFEHAVADIFIVAVDPVLDFDEVFMQIGSLLFAWRTPERYRKLLSLYFFGWNPKGPHYLSRMN